MEHSSYKLNVYFNSILFKDIINSIIYKIMTAIELIKQRLDKVKANIQPKQDEFQIAEQEGRNKFDQWCRGLNMIPKFDNTMAAVYDAYDASINNGYYEIKNKPHFFKSTEELIKYEGLMLEEKKLLRLKEIWEKDKTKEFYYWMSFKDKILIHRIDFNKRYKIRYYDCPKETVGDRTLVNKRCCMIDIKDIVILENGL